MALQDLSTAPRRQPHQRRWASLLLTLVLVSLYTHWSPLPGFAPAAELPIHAEESLSKCRALHAVPAPPPDAAHRVRSDRYQAGTPPVLIRNATIWTGAVKGLEVVRGDVLLDQGLVKAVGVVEHRLLKGLEGLVEYDARGAWVTPG
jgi:hypothetical protein